MVDRQARAALTLDELPDLLSRIHRELSTCRRELDDLNVFPVPDGDTGTNVVLTLRAAVDACVGTPPDQLADAVARGALMGAAGNSGVILSQVVRALAEALQDGAVDGAGYAAALEASRRYGYEAIADPVEGTVLTAMTVAAEAAATRGEDDLADVAAGVCTAVHAAVKRTREQLDVLREAGVVDAGARAFEILVQAVHAHICGVPIDASAPPPPVVERGPGPVGQRENGSLEFRFEVQYLLEGPAEAAVELRGQLELLGDSVAVIAVGGLLNVHVHTNEIGAAIEEGLRHGRAFRIEVTAFDDQIARVAAQRETDHADDGIPAVGAVAVLPGDTLRRIAEDHGIAAVNGASGSLPNVAVLLEAAARVHAETVLVLPGHPNVVPTARQASAVADAEGGRALVVVEEADSVPAILAAIAVTDPDGDLDQALAQVRQAAAHVRVGEVVDAIRDAETPIGWVRCGQHLAVVGGLVTSAHDEVGSALRAVLADLASDDAEAVTLVAGGQAGLDPDSARRLASEQMPGAEIELLTTDAGPARWMVGVE